MRIVVYSVNILNESAYFFNNLKKYFGHKFLFGHLREGDKFNEELGVDSTL